MVKPFVTLELAAIAGLTGCKVLPSGASIDRGAAQKLSGAFMRDLVSDHVDQALDKMEPEDGWRKDKSRGGHSQPVRLLRQATGKPTEP